MKNSLKTAFLCTALSFCHMQCISAQSAHIQELTCLQEDLSRYNIYRTGTNPVKLSEDLIQEYLHISLNSKFERGNFKGTDESTKTNDNLNFEIAGQKQFKTISCYGSLSYLNQKQYNKRWNSTLLISPDNPFILGDTIASDFTVEKFDLQGGVSVRFNSRITAGLNLQYLVGSSANQTDPRPKTDGMHFSVNPGILYHLSASYAIGVSGIFDLLSESITHTLINPQFAYTYFRFNGLGNYSGIGTGTYQAYPRNYDGKKFQIAIQSVYNKENAWSDFLELRFVTNKENARDGGSVFTFLGGDFSTQQIALHNRTQLSLQDHYIHNLTISACREKNIGDWYEQTQYLDTEKNNQLSYKIQQKNKIHEDNKISVSGDYEIFCTVPQLSLHGFVSFENSDMKHFENDGYSSKYSRCGFGVSADKRLLVRDRNFINCGLTLSSRMPLNSSINAKEKLYDIYTAPMFEYQTAAYYQAEARINYQRLISDCWLGIYVNGSYKRYNGSNKYTSLFDDTTREYIQAGITLTL